MKRTTAAFMLLAGLGGGCMSTDHKMDMAKATRPATETARGQAPGVMRADGRDIGTGGLRPVTGGFDDRVGREAKGGSVPVGPDGQPAYYPGRGILPVPAMGPYGAAAAVGALPPGGLMAPINARTSIRFGDPERMRVTWYGPGGLSDTVLTTPARYNFPQGGIYR